MVIFKKVVIQKGWYAYTHYFNTERLKSKFENLYERLKSIREQFQNNTGSKIFNLDFHLSLMVLLVSRLSQ